MAEESLCKQYFHLQARVYLRHEHFMEFDIDSESFQNSSCIAFCFPSSELCIFFFKLRCPYSIFIAKVRFFVNGIFFNSALPKSVISHDDGINYPAVIIEILILFEHGHSAFRINRYTPGSRFKISG